MPLEAFKQYRFARFFADKLFVPLARKVSFAFATAFFTVMGSWFSTLYSALLIVSLTRFLTEQ